MLEHIHDLQSGEAAQGVPDCCVGELGPSPEPIFAPDSGLQSSHWCTCLKLWLTCCACHCQPALPPCSPTPHAQLLTLVPLYLQTWTQATTYLQLVGILIGQLFFGFLGDAGGRRNAMLLDMVIILAGLILLTASNGTTTNVRGRGGHIGCTDGYWISYIWLRVHLCSSAWFLHSRAGQAICFKGLRWQTFAACAWHTVSWSQAAVQLQPACCWPLIL